MTGRAKQTAADIFADKLRRFSEQIRSDGDDLAASDRVDATCGMQPMQRALALAEQAMRDQLEALARSNARAEHERRRYRHLFDGTTDACIVTDAQGIVRDVNRAASAMLGVDARQVRGKPLARYVDAGQKPALQAALAERVEVHDLELRLRADEGVQVRATARASWSADGREVLFMLRESPEASGDAGVAAPAADVARALRDKDELLARERIARERLERTSEARGRFLTVLSHDLRGPLSSVLGWTQILRRETLDATARERALATIERNARLQLSLIEELLDVTRIAEGGVELEIAPVDMGALVLEAIDANLPISRSRGVLLGSSVPGGPVLALGDAKGLRRVLAILLDNALELTPEGGHVGVSVAREGDSVVLRVVDDGRGIPPPHLPYVFDGARQASYPGVGLYTVKRLVALHGGRVSADSRGEGRGATFTVHLPAAGERSPGPPRSHPRLPIETDLSGCSVLVVEDEVDTRELIATLLRRHGADVAVAPTAATALAMLDARAPDVLVSDVDLPGTDGYALLERLRAGEGGHARAVPAIALTGYATQRDAERAIEAGFDVHIPKPVDTSVLVRAVHDVWGKRR